MSYIQKNTFLTPYEVASLLKLSKLTIYKYIKQGKLEAINFGGYYRIEQTALNEFITRHRVIRIFLQGE